MSVAKPSLGHTIGKRLRGPGVHQTALESHRRTDISHKPLKLPPESTDDARDVASRLLSTELFSKKFAKVPSRYKSPSHALKILGRYTTCRGTTLWDRFSRFRNIVTRCDATTYHQMLNHSIRRALEGKVSFRAFDILRDGQSLFKLAMRWSRKPFSQPSTLGVDSDFGELESLSFEACHDERLTLEERKQNLRVFNAFVDRLYRLEHPAPHLLAQGLYFAAEGRSASALQLYSQMMAPRSDLVVHDWDARELGAALSSLRLWIAEDPFEGVRGEQRKLQLSAVVTGADHDNQSSELVSSFQVLCAPLHPSYRGSYMYLLQYFRGGQGVLKAWENFHRTPRWRELATSEAEPSKRELALILHDVVEHLLIAGEPRLAWSVVSGTDWDCNSILPKTWNLLLDFPEHLTQMSEGMQEILLQKYEQDIQRIEETLGVEWTGGEEGSHMFIDGGMDPTAIDKAHDTQEH